MTTDICNRCHIEKPIEKFAKDNRKISGRAAICLSCKRELAKIYYYSDTANDSRKEYQRQYSKRPYVIKAHREKARTEKYKAVRREYIKSRTTKGENIEEYRQKKNARGAVLRAKKKGILPKQNTLKCIDCGNQARDYHHHLGYDECHWLDVIPLCKSCHNLRHRK